MHYQIETLKDHYTPAQVLAIRNEAKREGKEVSVNRLPSGLVEIEIKRYLDMNAIHRVRYIDHHYKRKD